LQLPLDDGVAIGRSPRRARLRPWSRPSPARASSGPRSHRILRNPRDAFGSCRAPSSTAKSRLRFGRLGLTFHSWIGREFCASRLRKSANGQRLETRPFSPKQLGLPGRRRALLVYAAGPRSRRSCARAAAESWAAEEMPALVRLDAYRFDPKPSVLARLGQRAPQPARTRDFSTSLRSCASGMRASGNIPLKYVLPDDVMIGPGQPADPSRSTNSDSCDDSTRGARRNLGEPIIEAVRRGEALPEDELPPRAPKPLGAQREALVHRRWPCWSARWRPRTTCPRPCCCRARGPGTDCARGAPNRPRRSATSSS